MPDAPFEAEDILVSGDRAVVRWIYRKMRNGQPWHWWPRKAGLRERITAYPACAWLASGFGSLSLAIVSSTSFNAAALCAWRSWIDCSRAVC